MGSRPPVKRPPQSLPAAGVSLEFDIVGGTAGTEYSGTGEKDLYLTVARVHTRVWKFQWLV